jgi:glucose/arabinose dehydrogenase
VCSIGHRNPQGLAFRPGDGAVFVAEHGTGCDDEVNRIVAGANCGWSPDRGGIYLEGAPMAFPGALPAVWASGCPTIAPSGATFVDGPGRTSVGGTGPLARRSDAPGAQVNWATLPGIR